MNNYIENKNNITIEDDFLCDSARSTTNHHENLSIPIKTNTTFAKRKVSDQSSASPGTCTSSFSNKLNSFDFNKTAGGNSQRSYFSKKNSKQNSAIYEESSFGNDTTSLQNNKEDNKKQFVNEFIEDFDRHKYFEDTAVKIYNHLSVTKFT